MYDSLHRNLRLWSVTPNESSFGKIGHDESGSKQEFISFYNFLATDLKLSDRTYTCDCGNKIDRDSNASINLAKYAIHM